MFWAIADAFPSHDHRFPHVEMGRLCRRKGGVPSRTVGRHRRLNSNRPTLGCKMIFQMNAPLTAMRRLPLLSAILTGLRAASINVLNATKGMIRGNREDHLL